uniref:Uncharacterized protein n=1 Tax=Parascaris univalens TaxID=6257 RepID=A0A915AIY0_PARUN
MLNTTQKSLKDYFIFALRYCAEPICNRQHHATFLFYFSAFELLLNSFPRGTSYEFLEEEVLPDQYLLTLYFNLENARSVVIAPNLMSKVVRSMFYGCHRIM